MELSDGGGSDVNHPDFAGVYFLPKIFYTGNRYQRIEIKTVKERQAMQLKV